MRTLAEQPAATSTEFDQELRHRYDAITLFAESLDGSMRVPSPYQFNGRELYAIDGGSVGEMLRKGIKDAEHIAAHKPNLAFELRRRQLEYEEYQDMLKLCCGELRDADGSVATTMVVTSDFPPELMDATRDVGGYKASRKETMLRVISFDDGTVNMFTQTLDGSNRQALEAIHRNLGYEPEAGELLGQRRHINAPPEVRHQVVDSLMGVYDRSMAGQFGGRWRAGRRQEDDQLEPNTFEFACVQSDLVEKYVQCKLQGTYDNAMQYNLLALLTERFEGKKMPVSFVAKVGETAIQQHYGELRLMEDLTSAGNQARSEGKTFSACGSSIGPDGTLHSDQQLEADGYGNRTNAETSYKFDKTMYCVVCQTPPKKDEAKKKCGPCGICKGCDGKLSKKTP